MDNKTVSLVLTSYNCNENIQCTLAGIEAQDYPNIEIIVADGASTAGTVESIRELEKCTKYTCKWISEKATGIYDAMNKGYALSTGEIIAFFNQKEGLIPRSPAASL